MTMGIVSGFGRCGTSLVLQMLDAGGIPTIGRHPAYEPPQVGFAPGFDLEWLLAQDGHAFKYLDPTQRRLPSRPLGPVLWLDRDTREQAKSIGKMVSAGGPAITRGQIRGLEKGLKADRNVALKLAGQWGPVTRLKFETLITLPMHAAAVLAETFAPLGNLDQVAAAQTVIVRSPKCQPNLNIEAGLIARGPALTLPPEWR